jgi:hypothetical protein
MPTKTNLKQSLFDAYDGFGDKRLKKIENEAPFIVDDRGPGDYGADKQLFVWFCQIFVEVIDGDCLRVTIRGGLPASVDVDEWFAAHDAEESAGGRLFNIHAGEQTELLELASRIEAIVAPGKKYTVRAYKYVCPRVAGSLRRLHEVLQTQWG